jgi:hypothetical protein
VADDFDDFDDIRPALSPDQWSSVLAQSGEVRAMFDGALAGTPFSAHAIAALLLLGEPFGFAQQDVTDELEVAAFCDAMAHELARSGDERAEMFRSLAPRHRSRAKRIAALLPPMDDAAGG